MLYISCLLWNQQIRSVYIGMTQKEKAVSQDHRESKSLNYC